MDKEELEFRVNQTIYKKVFDEDDCERISEYYNYGMKPSSLLYYSNNYKDLTNVTQSESRKSMEKFLTDEEGTWIKQKLLAPIKEINDKYFQVPALVFSHFGLLEYKENDQFVWHADAGTTGHHALRRISIVIFMSDRDEYEGGQLEFMPKLKEPLKMEKGYMVAFPSHKVHRVAPITGGRRRTLVSWVYEYRGP